MLSLDCVGMYASFFYEVSNLEVWIKVCYSCHCMIDIEEKNWKVIGGKFREARERQRLTQADIAAAVGITVNYYARVERAEEKPTMALILQIMQKLKIKKHTLFSE